jgi:hypothetical protein
MLTPEMIAELQGLEKQGSGNVRTEDVVTLAKKPSSALHAHPAFEWDIRKAAAKQWLEAARHVVQVWVGMVKDDGQEKPMRQLVHIIDLADGPVYRATAKVILENRAGLVNMVADRILSVIHSYPLSEFDAVVALVEQIRSGGNNVPKRGGKAGVAKRSRAAHSLV